MDQLAPNQARKSNISGHEWFHSATMGTDEHKIGALERLDELLDEEEVKRD